MGKILCLMVVLALSCYIAVFCIFAAEEATVYPDRWVFVSSGLRQDSDVSAIQEIIETSSEHGLNGMVFSAGLDGLSRKSVDYLRRLDEVKQICQEHNIEIIPNIFSVGYGGSILGHNRNIAAGLPVKNALFVVKDGEARLVADPPVKIDNSGFEEFDGNRLKNYRFHDKPGEISFVDHETVKAGKASLRFEHFGELDPTHGHARIMQEIDIEPHRYYRVTCWVKTAGLRGSFKIQVLTKDGRALAPFDPGVSGTTDWRKVTMAFNSLSYNKVRLYAGMWGGKAGKLWLDDLKIEEIGLINVLRRPGTPITITSEDGGTVYQEGEDYEYISDPQLHPWRGADHEPLPIRTTQNSRISNAQRLRVGFYHSMAVNRGQVSVCMSEPEIYDIWRKEAKLLHEKLQPQKYLLSMDEIRAGGSCVACKSRKMSIAEILGDCITKQMAILRGNNPNAKIHIWSDMLDRNHNAHGNYYLVEGDFTGSWNHVPKDLIIVCWYHKKRKESLKFFSDLGFQTLAGAYYDGDTLNNPKEWLEILDRTPNARGIMYTTWQNKYALLAGFGNLVTSHKRK